MQELTQSITSETSEGATIRSTTPYFAIVAQLLLKSELLHSPITPFHLKLNHKCYGNYEHAKHEETTINQTHNRDAKPLNEQRRCTINFRKCRTYNWIP